MKPPVILVFIDWFLPGYKAGGPVRSCANLLAHIGGNYRFRIITRNTDYCEKIPYEEIDSDKWNYFDENTEVYYLSEKQVSFSNIKKLIQKTHFDVLYVNGIFSFYFSILPLFILLKSKKRKIVAARGMLSSHALKIKRTKKRTFIFLMRLLGLYKNAVFQAASKKEAVEIKRTLRSPNIKLAPNLPRKNLIEKPPYRNKKSDELKLVFIGRIAAEKNLLFALKCLLNTTLNISLDVYGTIYNEAYWSDCKAIIAKLPENITFFYKGSADSNEIPAILCKYHFLFLPTTGENFGHIIIESLLSGSPVIISDNTPWQNLENENAGWDISLNDSERFGEALSVAAKMEQEEYNTKSNDAYNLALKHINTSNSIELNLKLFGNGH